MTALSVAKLKNFFRRKRNVSLNKTEKKNFCGKFGSIPTFRSTPKGKKCFCDELASVLHNIASVLIKVFSISLGFAGFFRSFFLLSKLLEFKEFNKTIIPFTLVGYETGYSYWLFTISYPTSVNGIIVNYTMPQKIQPIRMQESSCIFVSIPPNFPIDLCNSKVSHPTFPLCLTGHCIFYDMV